MKGDPAQVLDVMRAVLMEYMQTGLPEYQIEKCMFIGRSGRLIGDSQIIEGADVPAGLRIMMRSGHEYDLRLDCV